MIIDAHLHVFNREVAGARENFPMWPGLQWGAGESDLLAQMDAAGIDKAFLISYTPIDVMAHYPADKRDYMIRVFQYYLTKEHFVSVWERNPDRFYWFADSVDPRITGYVERAEQDLERGASGLKLLPLFVDTEMGDPAWKPIFKLLARMNKPCIIDLAWWYAGVPEFCPSVYGKYNNFTEYVAGFRKVLHDYADVRIQLAHFGAVRAPELDQVIDLIRDFPNLSCDLAAYQHGIWPEEPFPYWSALGIIKKLVEGLGADRIQWGTDWPYLGHRPFPDLIRAIREADFLSREDVDKIMGLNALRLLGA